MDSARVARVVRIRRLREQGHARLLAQANDAVEKADEQLRNAQQCVASAEDAVAQHNGPERDTPLRPTELYRALEHGRETLGYLHGCRDHRSQCADAKQGAEALRERARGVFGAAVRSRMRLERLLEKTHQSDELAASAVEEQDAEEASETLNDGRRG